MEIITHRVKSAQIRTFFWSVFSCIRTEYKKIRTIKTPYLGTFHAMTATTLLDIRDNLLKVILLPFGFCFIISSS